MDETFVKLVILLVLFTHCMKPKERIKYIIIIIIIIAFILGILVPTRIKVKKVLLTPNRRILFLLMMVNLSQKRLGTNARQQVVPPWRDF